MKITNPLVKNYTVGIEDCTICSELKEWINFWTSFPSNELKLGSNKYSVPSVLCSALLATFSLLIK